MERQERNIALETVRGAFAALFLPLSWAAGLPRAAAMLLHRARSPEERSASAARARFDTESWSLDLLAKLAALAPEKALGLLKFATQGDFLTPTCPRCSIKMISRSSTHEGRRFWGCPNYPRCKQTLYSTANAPA